MQKAYKNVDIQFLPDRILTQSNLVENSLKQISLNFVPIEDATSNLMISNNFFIVKEIGHTLSHQFGSYVSSFSNLIF